MSNVNKNITVEAKLISPPTYIYIYIYIYIYEGLGTYRIFSIEKSIDSAPQGYTDAQMTVQY